MASADYSKLISTLDSHLEQLSSDPTLDEDLISIASLQLPSAPEATFPRKARQYLIVKIYQALPHVGSPASLLRLLRRLLEPVPLSALFEIDPPVDFAAGLDLNATDYHDLTLSLLEKSDEKSAERLATLHRDVYEALVKLWLCVPNEGTGGKAGAVLAKHVEVGGLPVLKRLFRDKDIYELMLALCSLKSSKFVALSKTRKSIAQARLMTWLPKVGEVSWEVISESHHPDIESQYGLKPDEGLLDFAAVRMVDYEKDVLMHQTLIGFYSKLLLSQRDKIDSKFSSKALDYLVSRGIHLRVLKIFASSNDPSRPIDISFVQTDAAVYVASFTSLHPKLFLSDSRTQDVVLRTITEILSSTQQNQWADESPELARGLEVLRCLPRSSLIKSSPLLLIPTKYPSASAITTLGVLFHGPPLPGRVETEGSRQVQLNGPSPIPSDDPSEISAAKSLLQLYETNNVNMWNDITTHANLFGAPDVAIAANNFIRLIITARWDPLEYIMQSGTAGSQILSYLIQIPEIPVLDLRSEIREILMQRYSLSRVMLEAIQKSGKWADVAVSLKRRVDGRVLHKGHGGSIATMGS
jgi:hypothetical protein